MPTLSNAVFDAALAYISTNCNKAQVKDAGSVLVNSITLDGSNYGAPADNSGSGGGRKMECLSSSASDMKSILVTGSGSADTVALLATSVIHVVASISGADVALTSTDKVNLTTFSVIIKDPT
jgi:hypothetical protein